MNRILIILLSFLSLIGCGINEQDKELKNEDNGENMKSLIENVKLAINPNYKDWVLFENGTYIVFDSIDQVDNIEQEAIRLMKEYGPVYPGSAAGDFNVITLNDSEGWVVSGHGYGMYTYVHPSELDSDSPDDMTIGLYGRSKRNEDGENPKIVYNNSSKNN